MAKGSCCDHRNNVRRSQLSTKGRVPLFLTALFLVTSCSTSEPTSVADTATSAPAPSTTFTVHTAATAPTIVRTAAELDADQAIGSRSDATSTTLPVSTSSTQPSPQQGQRCTRKGSVDPNHLECRTTTDGLRWASTSLNGYLIGPRSDNAPCRLPDQRTDPRSSEIGLVIGFPLSLGRPMTQSIGELKLAAVAVDFPDFAGTSQEIPRLRDTASQVDKWLVAESQGRATSSWIFHEQWITLSKPAVEYRVQGFGKDAYQEVSTEIVDRVLELLELVDVDQLFVYFPDSLTTSEIGDDINPFSGVLAQIGIPTRERAELAGSRIRNMKGSGTISQRNNNQLWAIWAHELLHSMGLQVHSPENSALIDSVSNGVFTLSGWSRWLLGWIDDGQVACLKAQSLPATLDLVPLQVTDNKDGVRLVMIPLNETQAIAVESHRAFGTGAGLGASGTYGLLAYVIDSKLRPPYDPFTNDESVGTRFIYPDSVVAGQRTGFGRAAQDMWPLQPLMFKGETASTEGITIEFVNTAGFDTVNFSGSD